jgi:tetratricopeptide (TPR) repeat protein/lipopolysaccharide biosynthesis regulator YciM
MRIKMQSKRFDMKKRIYSAIAITLSLASITVATYVAQRKAQGVKGATPKTPTTAAQRSTAAPLRPADPNRAPQAAVDNALYVTEEFFGNQATVVRPYSVALERVSALIAQYPKDAGLRLHAARLSERNGQFDRAASEMNQYADLKRRSPDSLRRLAAFYHNRARFSDEVKTMRDLAQSLPVSERAPIYKRAAELARTRSLAQFKTADFFAELVAADPDNVQPVKDYVEELTLSNQNREALSVLTSFQPRFPSELAYFLKTRAAILEATDRRAAEEVYSSVFDPNWPRQISSDYYDLLRRFGRYRTMRRALQEKVRAGATDLQTASRLFSVYAYEGNNQEASRLLTELETRRAASPQAVSLRYTASELETIAAMFSSIGHYDQASRYLYTLYVTGGLQPSSPQREQTLYRLFKVLIDATGAQTRIAAGDLSFYKDVAQVDQNPGVMNGVLSLILSGTDPAQEFATEEKTAASYFNRALAYRIFTSFKQEFVASPRLGEMYLDVINVFSALDEHRLAIEAGREFQQRFPDSPKFTDVSLRMADSFVALKDRAAERALLASLLDRLARSRAKGQPLIPASSKRWTYGISPGFDQLIDRISYNIEAYSDTFDPTESNDDTAEEESNAVEEESFGDQPPPRKGPTYSSVLERYISSLATDDKKTETVALFWGEIKKHPKEEGLYERFLRWLGQAELISEQLKAYNQAIRQFDSNTWYHRLSRWYVREKRGRELTRYSRQLIDIFDEEEISEYLLRFAGYGSTAAGDQLDWNERFAYDLYSYAHNRFPRNTFFVRGMLTWLGKNDTAQWAKLSSQYYFADRSIREPYLAWLSKQNQLRDRYKQARGASGLSSLEPRIADIETAKDASAQPTAYQVFAADAAAWLSHHDEAVAAYRHLVALYPGEKQYAERLHDLARSFAGQSDKLAEEAAAVYSRMAEVYPVNHDYRIKAGEVYAEMGDFRRAGEQWDKLIETEPGERETYLEVATVYWDYYQFDQSIRVFKQLRDATGDQTIYAYRMGAVYEGKGDMDSAIAEYVKVLSEPGDGRDTVAKRLAQLARRKGVPEKIAAAYNRARAATPSDWQMTIGYAVYQAERDQTADALALLRSEVAKSSDVAFLESVRDLFRAILRPEDEQQVIARLASVGRDEREAMRYQLQLAAFLERHKQVDGAISIIDKLVAAYPTNVGVIEEAARFYWRAGLGDRALDLYKRSLAKAQGPNRRSLVLQLARRQSDAGRLADAEATLRAYYNENRDDGEIFGELARNLGAQNKLEPLAELYRAAFKDAKESGVGDILTLREGMIKTLDSLGKFQDAVDQYIEIINLYPENNDQLATAIDYAERHSLIDRLTAYYEKLTRESFKNYRWQLVLGCIYERRGNVAGATDQYRAAVANEPQRVDLRFFLASTLARQRRLDEAIAVLREGWALAGRDPQWLIEVARIQVQQGKRDDATQTVRQALASNKNAKVTDRMRVAGQLAGWGLDAEAARIYEESFAELPKTLKDVYVDSGEADNYIRALVRVEPAASAFQKIERMRSQYDAIAKNSQDSDGYRARSIVAIIDQSLRTDFGRGVIDYATTADQSALAQAIRSTTFQLTSYGNREELLRYLGIAHGAGLVEVEEQLYIQIKEAAFKARTRPEDTTCYNELRALVGFYNRRAAYLRGAETLAAQYATDRYKDRFDYQNQIANQYRLAGDRAKEMEWLRAAYSASSGSLVEGNTDWVDRYLSMVYEASDKAEIERLASTYNPRQLQLINFLIDKNDKALARKAIASANQSQAWTASRSGEVGLFLKDSSVEYEAFFKAALDIRPIGEMLGRKVDSARSLLGDDWYSAARNYGYWLGLNPSRQAESRHYALAEVEGFPGGADSQLELAAYYLDRKDTTRAAEHTQLAAELEPGASEVVVMRGLVALARGDRRGAVEAWGALISGRATVENAETYFKVMADNGLAVEALPQMENFLVAYINRRARNDESEDRLEAIKPLIREIAGRGAGDARAANNIAATLQNIVNRSQGDLVIGRMMIDESLMADSALAPVYRSMHQRLSDQAQAVFGTSQYENGYWNGTEFIYPAKELSEFRRRLLDYLIRTRAYDEARLLITSIRQEQADLELALEDDEDEYREDRYEWLPLAVASIEIRSGRDVAKAIAELRQYCGIDGKELHGESGLSERCLKAYALLIAERKEAEADTLLYDAYRAAARSRYSDDASLAGLAEIEARRNRPDEATRLLKLLVERSTDNAGALKLAAETAARTGRYNDAAQFREQIALANPEDAQNKLELARALAAAGRGQEAIERLAALIGERMPNSARAQAAEAIGEIVRRDRSLAARASAALNARAASGDAGALLALAAASEAAGNVEEARAALARIAGGPLAAVAHLKLGLIAAAAGRDADAAASFERAIYLDADGAMTDQTAFRSSGPRVQLIRLYNRSGRDIAAVRLAEGDGATQRTLIGAMAQSGEANVSGVVFEPSLDVARARGEGLRTIAELNDAASSREQSGLAAMVAQSLARLGDFDRAIAIERRRSVEARPEEKAAIEKIVADLMAARQASQARASALLRVGKANATPSIYAARITGG